MIQIHLFYFIVMFLAFITGLFKEFIFFTSIIFVHELGHTLAAMYYKWNIEKIIIMPFGGITIFKEKINRPIKEEFIILVMGPIFQITYYSIFIKFNNSQLLTNYHYALLLFNLLPIYPLDGSKLLNLFFNKILPFKLSHILMLIISFLFSILVISYIIFNKMGVVLLLIVLLLFFKLFEEKKKHNALFNKFLLERYMYDFKFKKSKIIEKNDVKKMFRDYKHLFHNKKNYQSEYEILRKRFDLSKRL